MSSTEIISKPDIRHLASKVLHNEAEALVRVAQFLDEAFEECIQEILMCKGRVVITGVGKSAIVGNKIVATLNSTGTPALFMHAADAVHGDLGMIQSKDMVICISKSGNTPEIKVLVPLLKRRGSKLIALVSNLDSYLAQQADYVINGSITKEACPNNLAPTTSTTVHMALGDAMAVCLLQLRNFSSQDFAMFHPGGSLGKQLYLKVGDIVSRHIPKIYRTTSIRDVIIEISSKRMGAAAVVEQDDRVAGIITDGDLRRMLQKTSDIDHLSAEDIMSASPKVIQKQELAVQSLYVMQTNKISQLLVVEGEKLAGLIHLHDLIREGIV
jgi:arabinose-5-phosphate isomerase